MTRNQMIDYIVDYYNDHFKWQKLVYGQEIDRSKVEAMSNQQLIDFINANCK